MNWRIRKRAEELALADGQQAVTRCAHCPWKYRGLVADGKKLFRLHVQHEHRKVAA